MLNIVVISHVVKLCLNLLTNFRAVLLTVNLGLTVLRDGVDLNHIYSLSSSNCNPCHDGLCLQPTPEEDEQDDEDGDVDDVSESDNDELDTDMIDERDSADDVIVLLFRSVSVVCWSLLTMQSVMKACFHGCKIDLSAWIIYK